MTHKRLCLTCKNKGCIALCRFVKVEPVRKLSETKREGTK